jgi:hypothetical protein
LIGPVLQKMNVKLALMKLTPLSAGDGDDEITDEALTSTSGQKLYGEDGDDIMLGRDVTKTNNAYSTETIFIVDIKRRYLSLGCTSTYAG